MGSAIPIEGACGGHHFPQTQTEAYNELLRDFFRANPKGGTRG